MLSFNAGSGKTPASRSATSVVAVSMLSLRLVPMTPLGRDTVYGDTVMNPTNAALSAPAQPNVAQPTIMPDAAMQSFGEMVATFEAAGATVVLLKMPISATSAQRFGGQQDPRYEATLLELAQRYTLTVISVDERLGFVDDYFADGLHMNAVGARAFSEALALFGILGHQ